MFRKSKKKLAIRFLQRSVLFANFFCLSNFVFFIYGNWQDFLDATQLLLLSIVSIAALLGLSLAAVLFLVDFFFIAGGKKMQYVPSLVISVFSCAFLTAVALVSRGLISLAGGM